MGHYASEMGFFDPSEETIKFNARIDRMHKLLETIGLTRFSAADVYHIFMVMNPRLEYKHHADNSLAALEKILNLGPIE